MKSIFTLLMICIFSASLIHADPVSQDEAREIAILWYAHIQISDITDFSISNAFTITHKEISTIHVFNFNAGGFVVVAANDASIPILGYDTDNSFPEEMACPAVQFWIENYSKQIVSIIKEGISNAQTIKFWENIKNGLFPEDGKDVDPLLTTTWDQGCYYNALCPTDPAGPCDHVPVGCVATAMSQIMKYHNFPPQGVGEYTYSHPNYGNQTANFGNTAYDWASMPDNVSSNNTAVATLCYHAGVSVNMNYTSSSSYSFSEFVHRALVDFFNYNPDIQIHYQKDYPDVEAWKNLLRNDLDKQLPIYYSGNGDVGGHAFVCDGYKLADETFHFNWGWSGIYNGWFVIGNLNPGGMSFDLFCATITQIKPYNPNLVIRISSPTCNSLVNANDDVNIIANVEIGNSDQILITIDDETVAAGSSGTLEFNWTTTDEDCGCHEVKAWAISENDSVYHSINLNVSTDWKEQAAGFETPRRLVSFISAVDSDIAWAIPRDGINEWGAEIQEFTRTTDGGNTWIAGTIEGCEGLRVGMICGISSLKAYTSLFKVSGSTPQGIYVTEDGGATWERQESAAFSTLQSFPDCIHFFNENDGWCMGDPYFQNNAWEFEIYTTTDGGENWVAVPADNKPNALNYEYGILTYSAVNDTIWFGTGKGRVYKSVDKGYNWTVSQVQGMEDQYITPVFFNGMHGIVHNLFFPNWLLFEEIAPLYETFDGGETWEEIEHSGPLYFTDIAYVPGTDNTLVSTGGHWNFDEGASYSTDGGHTWTAFPGTFGSKFRQMAWVNPQCGWAGSMNSCSTEGGIIKFTGDLSSMITSASKYTNETNLSIYPNPIRHQGTIGFKLPSAGFVEIVIYDITGKRLETLLSENLTIGNHTLSWMFDDLQNGTYFCTLKTNEGMQTKKIIKL
jgi:photosystem II stability/assembly factor-like uncharacterized protein